MSLEKRGKEISQIPKPSAPSFHSTAFTAAFTHTSYGWEGQQSTTVGLSDLSVILIHTALRLADYARTLSSTSFITNHKAEFLSDIQIRFKS
jgi:hypothetical protein